METTDTTTADVKAAITETDVLTWIRDRAASIGIDGLILSVDSGDRLMPWVAKVQDDFDAFGCGHSLDAALGMLIPTISTPKAKADKKRADAQRLIDEAAKLEAEAAA